MMHMHPESDVVLVGQLSRACHCHPQPRQWL